MTKSNSGDQNPLSGQNAVLAAISTYWNEHIHDLKIARDPGGSKGFFEEVEAYHFEKLEYLPRVIDFPAYKGKRLLEVGCGIGIDLVRFAKLGAIVTGIDLSERCIELAKRNFDLHGVNGDLLIMNGEQLMFNDECFDVVYSHGVLQYTADPTRMIQEIHRVLRRGGEAILMVYNRHSWLNALSKLFGVKLEHEDAPVFQTHTISEFRGMLSLFSCVDIIPERFPIKTRLHHGVKAKMFNTFFVRAFNMVPRSIVQPLGWHLIAKAIK